MDSSVITSVESFIANSCYLIIFSITFPLLVLFLIDVITYVYQLGIQGLGNMIFHPSSTGGQSPTIYIDKNHQVILVYESLQGIEIKSMSYWNYFLTLFACKKVDGSNISDVALYPVDSNSLSPIPSNPSAGQRYYTAKRYFNRMWLEKLRKSE